VKGLYWKYTLINNETGEEVKSPAFILKPETDPHALHALKAYAQSVHLDNPVLAADLKAWIERIEDDIS
jgi:hypothetical protein